MSDDEYTLFGLDCPSWLNQFINDCSLLMAWWLGVVTGLVVAGLAICFGLYLAYG